MYYLTILFVRFVCQSFSFGSMGQTDMLLQKKNRCMFFLAGSSLVSLGEHTILILQCRVPFFIFRKLFLSKMPGLFLFHAIV